MAVVSTRKLSFSLTALAIIARIAPVWPVSATSLATALISLRLCEAVMTTLAPARAQPQCHCAPQSPSSAGNDRSLTREAAVELFLFR
jgi:hypothetical protein